MARPKDPEYQNADGMGKLAMAHYGKKANAPSFRAALYWIEEVRHFRPRTPGQALQLIEYLHRRFRQGDVDFFTALAEICDRDRPKAPAPGKHIPVRHTPEDRVRAEVAQLALMRQWEGRTLSFREVSDALHAANINRTARHIRRVCKQMGIVLRPGRVGRPRSRPKTVT